MIDQPQPPVPSESDYGARPTAPDNLNPEDWDQYDGEVREPESKPNGADHANLPLTLDQWASRKLPERDFLLGTIFTTTTRAMLSAKTGLGKTHLGFAFGFALSVANRYSSSGN